MTDADIPQSIISWSPDMIFILSTGRSGTKTIADYLSTLEGCECLHEPEPRLIIESSDFRYGRLDQKKLAETLRRSRPFKCKHKVYGESNQILSLIIPALHEAFPKARYIWLIRNGIDVVASAVGRNWYTGLSMDGKPYDQTHRIGQEWIGGRVQGHLCGDVDTSEWELMSPFEKCCWYWGYINRLIERDLQSLIAPCAYLLLKLENLDTSAGSLASWIGLEADKNSLVPHQNRAHYPVYSPQWWSDSQWKSFERWCGSLMDRMYPSWRTVYHYHRQIAAAEILIECNQLKKAEELFNGTRGSYALDARGHNVLGVLHVKKGDALKARRSYEAAVAMDPDNVCFLLNLADLLLVAEHRAQAALELYSRVLRHEPSNPQALMNKLVACLHLGRTHEAQELETILQALSSEKPEVVQWLQELRDSHSPLSTAIGSEAPRPTSDSALRSSAALEAISASASSPIQQVKGCAANSSTLASPRAAPQPVHLQVGVVNEPEIKRLDSKLDKIGWSSKFDRYREIFSGVRRLRVIEDPRISIIVISWRRHPDTLTSFRILHQQRNHGLELIFVDNGGPAGSFGELEEYVDTYVRLNTNTGAYLARNIGAVFADAPILFFLEDDGLPAGDIVSAHLKAHDSYEVISVRGVYFPKTPNNRINTLAKHYYLGDQPFPWHVNLEGNASYRADAFFSVGGWDDDNRFGHGGPELSRRLLQYEPDWCKQIYSPEPVILHDYASDHAHLMQKLAKQREQMQRIKERDPVFTEFLKQWQQYYLRSDLLKMKGSHPADSSWSAGHSPASLSAKGRPPLISIVIPTHNRCQYLKHALESALRQTAGNYEVVVVDDGSEDETEDLIRSLSCERLHYRKKDQTGAPDTRNFGIEMAHGDFILWLDDDDTLSADTVATHSEVVAQHPQADVSYGVLQEFDDQTGKATRLFDPKDWSLHGDMLLSSLVAGCCIPNPGTMVRRSCYESVGFYDKGFPRAHDYEFWTRAAGHFKFHKNYNVVCRYRVHSTNLSAGNMVDRSFESRIIRRMVGQYGLKRIYHWFDWSNPEAAEAAALYAVSSNLFKIGDLHHCALYLEKIPIQLWNADIAELGLNCVLYRGRWRQHGDLLEQVKKRNILAPLQIKLMRQKADKYWRFSHGLKRALNKNNPQEMTRYLNSIENDHFPMPPDDAVQMASRMLHLTNDRNVSFSSSFSLKLLQKAMMADPENKVIYQEIRKLPISESDQNIINSIRNRMLSNWDDSDHRFVGADRTSLVGRGQPEATVA